MPYFLRSSKGVVVSPILANTRDFSYTNLLSDAVKIEEKEFCEGHLNPFEPVNADQGSSNLPPLESFLDSFKPKRADYGHSSRLKRDLEKLQGSEPEEYLSHTRDHLRRKRKRHLSTLIEGHKPRHEVQEMLLKTSETIATQMITADMPATSCGYQAKPYSSGESCIKLEDLNKLLEDGFEYVKWDGYSPRPLTDANGRIFGCLAGQPEDSSFRDACRTAYETIALVGESDDIIQTQLDNRRGKFPVINIGITHGKGTLSPVNLHAPKKGQPSRFSDAIKTLLNDPGLQKLAVYASYSFSAWAPNLYQYYKSNLDKLWETEAHLAKNFPKSVFPCAAINFGPNVWTERHRDSMNCAFGWCAIQALGEFDHMRGGHLVLPDLRLVVEFPSGSTILIPSAILTHSNIPVNQGEKRASFTQYCAGGLFRYIDNHFMTEKALKSINRVEYEKIQAVKPLRWCLGLSLLSTIDDLAKNVEDESE